MYDRVCLTVYISDSLLLLISMLLLFYPSRLRGRLFPDGRKRASLTTSPLSTAAARRYHIPASIVVVVVTLGVARAGEQHLLGRRIVLPRAPSPRLELRNASFATRAAARATGSPPAAPTDVGKEGAHAQRGDASARWDVAARNRRRSRPGRTRRDESRCSRPPRSGTRRTRCEGSGTRRPRRSCARRSRTGVNRSEVGARRRTGGRRASRRIGTDGDAASL